MLTTFHPSSTQRSTMVWNASNLWQMTIFHAGSCPCCDDSSALSCVLVKLINYLRGLRMDASQWFHCWSRRLLSATELSRIKQGLIWDFATDGIGVGRWHGRTFLEGNARRRQVSVLVVE